MIFGFFMFGEDTMKTEKRNVLRACILTMLLAMPIVSTASGVYPWSNDNNIAGEYPINGRNIWVYFDEPDKQARSEGDVTIKNTEKADYIPKQGTMAIIGAPGVVNASLTIDMGGHDLTAGDYGSFVNLSGRGSKNKVVITNAGNIVNNSHRAPAIYAEGEGQKISLDAKENIEFMNNKTHNDTSLVYVRNTDSAFSLSAGQDIVIDNKSPGTIIELRETGTVTIDAKNDVVFNQELDTLNLLYSNDHTQLNLSSADKNIRFNNKGNGIVVYGTNKAEVNLVAGNDITYNNQRENARPVYVLESESKASIEARNDIILKDAQSVKMFDLKGTSSVNAVADNDIFVNTKAGQVVSLIDTDASSTADITAGHDMTLDIGVAAPVVHAKGTVNLKAGNDMRLSTAGTDSLALQIANLYADGREANITAEATAGTLTISNKGAVGAYADNSGSITLGGKVVMNTADGAVVTDGGKIILTGHP